MPNLRSKSSAVSLDRQNHPAEARGILYFETVFECSWELPEARLRPLGDDSHGTQPARKFLELAVAKEK